MRKIILLLVLIEMLAMPVKAMDYTAPTVPDSGKQYLEQSRIAKEVLYSRRCSEDIKTMVKGFMIESYIEDGNQKVDGGVYGKSITDPCLGWEKSEKLIYDIAEMV